MGNEKQRMYECKLQLVNKQNQCQIINVKSAAFDSKKKSEIAVYKQFNLNYIRFETLMLAMTPYSFSRRSNALQSQTIIIEPLPLNCNESDILTLIGDRDLIKYIEFVRDSQKAIFQRAFVEFFDCLNANKFVKLLNLKNYRKHKLFVTQSIAANNKQCITKKDKFLKIVGWPNNISKNSALQFLYRNGINPMNICLIFKYSLIAEIFLQFETVKDSVAAFDILYKRSTDKLFCRYSAESEYKKAVLYSKNIKKIKDEVIRRSNCIDVANVSWDSNNNDLMKIFLQCGKIKKIHINHRKDLNPGTAFIEFEEIESSEKAIMRLNGYGLNGQRLRISMHLKQTSADKKQLKQWYTEMAQEKMQKNKKQKEEKIKRKKQRAKKKKK